MPDERRCKEEEEEEATNEEEGEAEATLRSLAAECAALTERLAASEEALRQPERVASETDAQLAAAAAAAQHGAGAADAVSPAAPAAWEARAFPASPGVAALAERRRR